MARYVVAREWYFGMNGGKVGERIELFACVNARGIEDAVRKVATDNGGRVSSLPINGRKRPLIQDAHMPDLYWTAWKV